MPRRCTTPHSSCFNSRLREEATSRLFAGWGVPGGFNSRLREEATVVVSLLANADDSFNSRLREEATVVTPHHAPVPAVSTHASVRRRQPLCRPALPPRQFQLTPP